MFIFSTLCDRVAGTVLRTGRHLPRAATGEERSGSETQEGAQRGGDRLPESPGGFLGEVGWGAGRGLWGPPSPRLTLWPTARPPPQPAPQWCAATAVASGLPGGPRPCSSGTPEAPTPRGGARLSRRGGTSCANARQLRRPWAVVARPQSGLRVAQPAMLFLFPFSPAGAAPAACGPGGSAGSPQGSAGSLHGGRRPPSPELFPCL